MDYSEKIVLHIPQRTWNNGLLKVVGYQEFEDRLAATLSENGIDGFYVNTVTAYYKERSYLEDLLTVYCESEKATTIVLALLEAYRKYNDIMQQDSVAFEQNGVMHIIPLNPGT